MKYKSFIFLVLLAPLTLLSCKKEKVSQSLIGTWELRTAYNGQGGKTDYAAGNGHLLKFTATTYQVYSGGSLLKSGMYTLVKDSSYMLGKIADRIVYDGEQNSVRSFAEIKSTNLTLTVDAYDGPSALYARIE